VPFIATIVEGHGEVEAVPALLHRIAGTSDASGPLKVNQPIRVKAGSFLNDQQYFCRHIELAAGKAAQEGGAVLILLDCDDGCPATIGPDLLARAQQVRNDVRIFVALAYREYESWFIAASASLSANRQIVPAINPPGNIDEIRDAKGWIGERFGVAYDPVVHQLLFTRAIALEEARTSASFERLYQFVLSVTMN
jgi:hypothetical protein